MPQHRDYRDNALSDGTRKCNTSERLAFDLANIRDRMRLDVCSVFLNPFAQFLTAIRKLRVIEKKRSPVSAMSSVVSR